MDTFAQIIFERIEIRREFFGYKFYKTSTIRRFSISNKLETSSPGHTIKWGEEREREIRDCLGRVWDRRFGQKFGGRGRPVFAGSKAVAAAAAVASRRKKNSARPVVWVCPNNSSTFLRSRFTDFTKPTPRQPTFQPGFLHSSKRVSISGGKVTPFLRFIGWKKGPSFIIDDRQFQTFMCCNFCDGLEIYRISVKKKRAWNLIKNEKVALSRNYSKLI